MESDAGVATSPSQPCNLPPLAAQVIKDYATTFYKAGLAPAANVHLSLDAAAGSTQEGPLLRPEVTAIQGPPPAERGLPYREEREAPADQVIASSMSREKLTANHARAGVSRRGKPLSSRCMASGTGIPISAGHM